MSNIKGISQLAHIMVLALCLTSSFFDLYMLLTPSVFKCLWRNVSSFVQRIKHQFLPLQPKFPLFLFGQPGISAQLFTHSEQKQTQIFSEISGNNDKTSFPLARLISHILCYILSYESFKWHAHSTLATLSVTYLQTNRQGETRCWYKRCPD